MGSPIMFAFAVVSFLLMAGSNARLPKLCGLAVCLVALLCAAVLTLVGR